MTPQKSKTIYMQVKERALPLLECFHNDLLEHDKRDLSENRDIPFIHITTKTSTHLVFMKPSNGFPEKGVEVPYLFGMADREHVLNGGLVTIKYFDNPLNGPVQLVQYFNGKTVKIIDTKKAISVYQDYMLSIRSQWRSNHG